ncbi:MAG: DUF4383 domain-containing protein [Thermoleophilia bacterium]|nr:DUF4383 domain-containing protein [Thermoleophilia bacterium]
MLPPIPRAGTAGLPRPSLVIARLLSGLFLILGIVGMLRAAGRTDGSIDFIVFTISPGIAYIHLAIGLAGVALVGAGDRWTLVYLAVAAVVFLLWAVVAAIADGGGVLMRDSALVLLHLLTGLAAAAGAAAATSRTFPGPRPSSADDLTRPTEPAER